MSEHDYGRCYSCKQLACSCVYREKFPERITVAEGWPAISDDALSLSMMERPDGRPRRVVLDDFTTLRYPDCPRYRLVLEKV